MSSTTLMLTIFLFETIFDISEFNIFLPAKEKEKIENSFGPYKWPVNPGRAQ
jgi:hypothetical protein